MVKRLVNEATLTILDRVGSRVTNARGVETSDIDLLSLLVSLANRHAVIQLPDYERRFPQTMNPSDTRVGTRYGKILRLIAHKKALSFSARILDLGVVTQGDLFGNDTMGAFRTYTMVDANGTWYPGWKSFTWKPSAREDEVITRTDMEKEGMVNLAHWVHPNRRQSIFGAPYLTLKMLLVRLEDELAFYRKEVKRLEGLGIPKQRTRERGVTHTTDEPTKRIQVKSIIFEVDTPPLQGLYTAVIPNEHGMRQAETRVRELTYQLIPHTRFVVRANEAAYFHHGMTGNFIPHWMGSATWERNVRLPGRRTRWSKLTLPGGAALRYRTMTFTEHVRA